MQENRRWHCSHSPSLWRLPEPVAQHIIV